MNVEEEERTVRSVITAWLRKGLKVKEEVRGDEDDARVLTQYEAEAWIHF